MYKQVLAVAVAALVINGCATVQDTMDTAKKMVKGEADSPSVRIMTPADGATVSSPVKVEFGLEGMAVSPAGVEMENAGHHHLIINASLPDMTLPIPANENYLHFGGGQTETELELDPGTYTLQLLMGNHIHIPHEEPVYSEVINITVE